MAIEQKELYVVKMRDGKIVNAVCQSYQEVVQMFGEENIEQIEKHEYEEPKED